MNILYSKISLFLFIIVLIAFGTLPAQAQVSIIPKMGIGFGSISQPRPGQDKSVFGLMGGVGVNLPLGSNGAFSLQPELLITQKGYDGAYRYHLQYLEFPLLAKISFGSQKVRAFINAGPSIGYAISQKFTSESSTSTIDFDENQNRTDIGIQLGGGIGYRVGPGSILLDVRAGYGFSKLVKKHDPWGYSGIDSKTRLIAITIGYAIPIGKK